MGEYPASPRVITIYKMLIFRNTMKNKDLKEIVKNIKKIWATKIGLLRFHLGSEDLSAHKAPQ